MQTYHKELWLCTPRKEVRSAEDKGSCPIQTDPRRGHSIVQTGHISLSPYSQEEYFYSKFICLLITNDNSKQSATLIPNLENIQRLSRTAKGVGL